MSDSVKIGKFTEEEHFIRNIKFMLSKNVSERLKFGKRNLILKNFRSKKPRVFNSTSEYRKWLNTLPKWMNYGS